LTFSITARARVFASSSENFLVTFIGNSTF
jgi:hypothetical protein